MFAPVKAGGGESLATAEDDCEDDGLVDTSCKPETLASKGDVKEPLCTSCEPALDKRAPTPC